ncbi:porin OmpC [Enterobacter sp. E105B]|uniref:porin OmpC n=1 Tax=Enterobacter sp. E105B TaxID=3047465 RepID=UPI0025A0C998|nr:porin OmpC [Enterobacter sp. E105B]
MNKKIALKTLVVAVAVSCSLASHAVEIYNKNGNRVELYGKFDAQRYMSDDKGNDGDKSYFRPGIRGETMISESLTGYADWESQIQLNQPESNTDGFFTRVGYAGLKLGNMGSLDYGRNYGVSYDLAAWTDVLPEFGGDAYGADNFLFQRSNGLLTYRNSDFFGAVDGLNIALQYIGKNGSSTETANGRDVLSQNGDGYGASAIYDLGAGFSAGGSWFSVDRTNEQNGASNPQIMGRGSHASSWSAGLKYDAEKIYLAAVYREADNAIRFGSSDSSLYGYADKANQLEVVAQYQFDFGLRPSVSYIQSRATGLENRNINGVSVGGDQDLMKYVDLGATYYLNKNFAAFADYKINLLDENSFNQAAGISTDDIVSVGMIYQF